MGARQEVRPSVEDALAALEPATADEARAAMDWMLPDGGDWPDVTQLGLQDFLWYGLPMKWLTEEAHHHEVGWALGDLFESVGLHRYAALCRSEDTHRLIARWEPDREGARRQLRRLMERSGVDPLDTDLLTWGEIQGVEENAASRTVSRALEAAVEDGRLVPGGRGWRHVADDVSRATLLAAAAPDDPRPLVDTVEAERLGNFLTDLDRGDLAVGAELRALLARDGHEVRAERLSRVSEGLEPLRWLLGEIGEGVRLTQAGYLPKALALAADERYGWFGLAPRFTVRGERDLPELTTLRDLAREGRLLTVRKPTLSLSARGRALLDDPGGLSREVLARFLARGTWAGDAALALAVVLLSHPQDGRPLLKDDLDQAVLGHLSPRWRSGDQPVTQRHAAVATWDAIRLARVFGWVEERDAREWRHAPLPTTAGRLALETGLQMAAVAPRTSL
jgi:hypothetical protein